MFPKPCTRVTEKIKDSLDKVSTNNTIDSLNIYLFRRIIPLSGVAFDKRVRGMDGGIVWHPLQLPRLVVHYHYKLQWQSALSPFRRYLSIDTLTMYILAWIQTETPNDVLKEYTVSLTHTQTRNFPKTLQ
jgi:hypothetical protein